MLKSLNFQDMRKKAGIAIDNRVRIITAGMGLDELRAVVRGDPPTEKPNPRYRVHTTSFLFHIRPRYYEKGSTILSHTFRLGFFTAFFFFDNTPADTAVAGIDAPAHEDHGRHEYEQRKRRSEFHRADIEERCGRVPGGGDKQHATRHAIEIPPLAAIALADVRTGSDAQQVQPEDECKRLRRPPEGEAILSTPPTPGGSHARAAAV